MAAKRSKTGRWSTRLRVFIRTVKRARLTRFFRTLAIEILPPLAAMISLFELFTRSL